MMFKVFFLEVEEGAEAVGEGVRVGVGVVRKVEGKVEGKGEFYHSNHSAEDLTGRVKKGVVPLEICPLEVFYRGKGCPGVTLREVQIPAEVIQ
jgi:hypothetical protein